MDKEIRDPSGLIWYPDLELGYLPVGAGVPYDAEYFQKYVGYKANPIGAKLTAARVDLASKHCGVDAVTDIGIGCGHFIEVRGGATYGYDVNPVAIRWLLERDLWADPFAGSPMNVTCWDSLEHMEHPDLFIDRVKKTVIVSLPVFDDLEHVLRSKHFRPGEHVWYWTEDGFVRWMLERGFACLEQNWMETTFGREDIGTFVFERSK